MQLIFSRITDDVTCSHTIKFRFLSRVIPLHLLDGFLTSSTFPLIKYYLLILPGISEKSRLSVSGFQIGPLVNLKPVASFLIFKFLSTKLNTLSS